MDWYESLAKPEWTPSGATIGTVWTILYPIIAVVFGYTIFRVLRGEWPTELLVPIGVNLIANLAFTPLLFGLHNLRLAAIDIVIVLATIVWCMVALWPHSRVASVALAPYLVWVATATVLQFSLIWFNG